LSIDTKAALKIGPFSRGGYKRHGAAAIDHDFEAKTTLKLFGIHRENYGQDLRNWYSVVKERNEEI
jgi:hypothetical protein